MGSDSAADAELPKAEKKTFVFTEGFTVLALSEEPVAEPVGHARVLE